MMAGAGKGKKQRRQGPIGGSAAAPGDAPGGSQTSNWSRESPLPTQYNFTPTNTSANAPPRFPAFSARPGVKDYPPPTQLFNTSTSRRTPPPLTNRPSPSQRSPPQPRTASSPQPPPRSSPQPQESPRSSQAQNEHDEDEEDGGTEATLSDQMLAAVNAMVTEPGRGLYTTVLSPNLEPGTTWFGYDKGSLTRKVTKTFTRKFDGPFYSWGCVPPERRERYFLEFAKEHTWVPSLTRVVQTEFDKICQRRMKDMVSKANTTRVQPRWINGTLWRIMTTHWDTEDARTKSETTSAARLSDRNGLGPHKHVSGQKSFGQVEQEMIVEKGRPVSIGEVFLRTHTRADGTFVDVKAQTVAEVYQQKREAKLAELRTDASSDGTSGDPQLTLEEDNEIFLQSTFTNSRGDIYGIGSIASYINGKRKYSGSSSSTITTLQKQLQDAHRKIEEQAALNAQQQADVAAQQTKINDLTLVQEYLRETDPNFLAFIATRAKEKNAISNPEP